MKIPVEIATLHNPWFHRTGATAGKSLGVRLDTREQKDLKLEWDSDSRMLSITWGGRTGYAMDANVAGIFPFDDQLPAPVTKLPPPAIKRQVSAQVSGPHDHVFAGPGGGKA